jgi:hypothetical protein
MHCGRNIIKNFMKTKSGEKDILKVCMGLKDANMHIALFAVHTEKKSKKLDFAASFICAYKER